MKYKYIDYIIDEFIKQYPTTSAEKLENRLSKVSEDELYRIANMIERFGIENVAEVVKNSI